MFWEWSGRVLVGVPQVFWVCSGAVLDVFWGDSPRIPREQPQNPKVSVPGGHIGVSVPGVHIWRAATSSPLGSPRGEPQAAYLEFNPDKKNDHKTKDLTYRVDAGNKTGR